jgi:hypothetical protein
LTWFLGKQVEPLEPLLRRLLDRWTELALPLAALEESLIANMATLGKGLRALFTTRPQHPIVADLSAASRLALLHACLASRSSPVERVWLGILENMEKTLSKSGQTTISLALASSALEAKEVIAFTCSHYFPRNAFTVTIIPVAQASP